VIGPVSAGRVQPGSEAHGGEAVRVGEARLVWLGGSTETRAAWTWVHLLGEAFVPRRVTKHK